LEEAKYYGIEEVLPELEELVEGQQRSYGSRGPPLSRSDVVTALLTTPVDRELRFAGVDMAGADLSKLDLRRINFK